MKSQLAGVNIQPSVGMFPVFDVSHRGCFVKQLPNFKFYPTQVLRKNKQLLNVVPHVYYKRKIFDSYQLTVFVTFLGEL